MRSLGQRKLTTTKRDEGVTDDWRESLMWWPQPGTAELRSLFCSTRMKRKSTTSGHQSAQDMFPALRNTAVALPASTVHVDGRNSCTAGHAVGGGVLVPTEGP